MAYRLNTARGEWVVRRNRRGGALAPLLRDRYFRLGESRATRELAVSTAVRERAIRSPRVVAAVLYPGGLFCRADVVTEYVPLSADLAELAFGAADQPAAVKAAAFGEAGRLVKRLADAQVWHPDLNLKNILVDFEQPAPRAWVLDLDKARIGRSSGQAMWQRLQRSIAKWERLQGRALDSELARALTAGFNG